MEIGSEQSERTSLNSSDTAVQSILAKPARKAQRSPFGRGKLLAMGATCALLLMGVANAGQDMLY